MPLKSFDEIRNINVLPFCDIVTAKNERYMSIPNCMELLHKCGAEDVYVEIEGSGAEKRTDTQKDDGAKKDISAVVKLRIGVDGLCFEGISALDKAYAAGRKGADIEKELWYAQCIAFCTAVSKYTGLGADIWGESGTALNIQSGKTPPEHGRQ